MTLTLYVEGGGDSKKDLKVECRKGRIAGLGPLAQLRISAT